MEEKKIIYNKYIDKQKIFDRLSKDNIIKIIQTLGCKDYKFDSSGNICFSTFYCHGGDSPYKLIYYLNDERSDGGTVHCFTCGQSFNIIELVIRAFRAQGKTMTYYKALRFLAYVLEIPDSEVYNNSSPEKTITDFEWINRLKSVKKNSKAVPNLSEINENILDIFWYAPYQGWLDEHITREAMSRFEIGYYGLTNQITIPHRDIHERLIGIRGRFLNDEDAERFGKYVPLQIGGRFLSHQLGSNLYGIHVAKDKIQQCKKVMLVEAEKSVLQAYSYFGEDSFVVGLCGSNISKTQIKIILEQLKVEEVIVGMDREYGDSDTFEATAYYQKLIKKVAPLVPYVRVYLVLDKEHRLDYKDSPTDKGKDILLQLMKEKILVTMEDVNEVIKRKD